MLPPVQTARWREIENMVSEESYSLRSPRWLLLLCWFFVNCGCYFVDFDAIAEVESMRFDGGAGVGQFRCVSICIIHAISSTEVRTKTNRTTVCTDQPCKKMENA